jgi:hypothetical protein
LLHNVCQWHEIHAVDRTLLIQVGRKVPILMSLNEDLQFGGQIWCSIGDELAWLDDNGVDTGW